MSSLFDSFSSGCRTGTRSSGSNLRFPLVLRDMPETRYKKKRNTWIKALHRNRIDTAYCFRLVKAFISVGGVCFSLLCVGDREGRLCSRTAVKNSIFSKSIARRMDDSSSIENSTRETRRNELQGEQRRVGLKW